MPDKKAPVIVVKKTRLNAPAAEYSLSEPDATPEKSAPLSRNPLSKQARNNRERMAHLTRAFPALWPDFDKGKFRPMKVGIKEQVKAWIEAHPDCGMTFGEWVMAIRVVTARIEYQRCVKEGEPRYDIHGEPAGEVTAREAVYARLQVSRIKARLDAYRDKKHDA